MSNDTPNIIADNHVAQVMSAGLRIKAVSTVTVGSVNPLSQKRVFC